MDKQFAIKYLNTPSPVMYETRGQALWAETIRPYVDEIRSDNYGNIIAIKYGRRTHVISGKDQLGQPISSTITVNSQTAMKVLLDAHADEISFVVNDISDDGFIHPLRNGGVDILLSLSRDVLILTTDGKEIHGYFGSLPIHQKDKKHKDIKPESENLFIDIGCNTKQEVLDMGIKIGDPIVYDVQARIFNENRLVAKSLDDKAGCLINLEVLKQLHENSILLPFDLYVVNSVQEEVGSFGIQMAVEQIKPDIAIVFDAYFDSTNPLFSDSKKMLGTSAKLGDGVMIMNGTCVQKNLRNLFIETAKAKDIKFCEGHSTGYGGTNADRIFMKNIVTGLLSIPLRYMHTTVETVDLRDMDCAVDLIYHSLLKIEYNHDFKYHKF